jgi:hypothetical protein
MTTTPTTGTDLEKITSGLQSFEARKAALINLKNEAAAIVFAKLESKDDYKIVSTMRKTLKSERAAVQREGKSMRDILTPISKMIMEREKDLVAIISPEEDRLSKLEEDFEREEAEKKAEAERIAKLKIQGRIDALAQYNAVIDYDVLVSLTDEQFEAKVDKCKEEYEAEQCRLAEIKAAEEAARKQQEEKEAAEKAAEQARIKAEKDKLEKQRQEQAAEQLKLKKEREEMEAEKARMKAEKEAAAKAEQDRLDAIEKQRLADEKRKQEEKQQAEYEAKLIEVQPDVIKAENIIKSMVIDFPKDLTFQSKEIEDIANAYVTEAHSLMNRFIGIINKYKTTNQ